MAGIMRGRAFEVLIIPVLPPAARRRHATPYPLRELMDVSLYVYTPTSIYMPGVDNFQGIKCQIFHAGTCMQSMQWEGEWGE